MEGIKVYITLNSKGIIQAIHSDAENVEIVLTNDGSDTANQIDIYVPFVKYNKSES